MLRHTIKNGRWLPFIILLTHSILVGVIASKQSVTFDETGHLAAGLAHWKHADFSLYAVNPPLPRMVAMLPVLPLLTDFDFPTYNQYVERREELRIGIKLATDVKLYHLCSVIARLALLPFSWLGGLTCYYWARDLYGYRAAVIALLLWCFSPNIQANASQVLPDLAATSLFIATCFLLRGWLKNAPGKDAVSLGVVLGIALLTKFTAVLLVPLIVVVVSWSCLSSTTSAVVRRLGSTIGTLVVILGCSLLVVNIGYFFEGTLLPLRQYEFLSELLSGIPEGENIKGNRFVYSWAENVLIPLPRSYVLGIDLARYELERGYWSYLNGEFSNTGWWYFYLYGLAIKEPLGLWGLFLVAAAGVVGRLAGRTVDVEEWLLVGAPLLVLAALCSQMGYTHHVRYALPALPFAYVLAACKPVSRLLSIFQYACVSAFVVSSCCCFPHQISYFNEAVGGPANGWKHLTTSNFDWGQDLLYLRDWIEQNPDKQPLFVSSSGAVPPRVYGINCKEVVPDLLPSGRLSFPPGWYAISVGDMLKVDSPVLPFLEITPADRVAYSVFVFHVERPFVPARQLINKRPEN